MRPFLPRPVMVAWLLKIVVHDGCTNIHDGCTFRLYNVHDGCTVYGMVEQDGCTCQLCIMVVHNGCA